MKNFVLIVLQQANSCSNYSLYTKDKNSTEDI